MNKMFKLSDVFIAAHMCSIENQTSTNTFEHENGFIDFPSWYVTIFIAIELNTKMNSESQGRFDWKSNDAIRTYYQNVKVIISMHPGSQYINEYGSSTSFLFHTKFPMPMAVAFINCQYMLFEQYTNKYSVQKNEHEFSMNLAFHLMFRF